MQSNPKYIPPVAIVTAGPNAADANARPEPHTAVTSLLLHIGPGAVAAGTYFALVSVAHAWGLPSGAALAASALLGVAPLQAAILLRHNRRHCDVPSQQAIQLRAHPRLRPLAAWTMVVVVLAGIAFSFTKPLAAVLEATAFSWWPQQWKVDLGTHGGYSDSALIWTAVLLFVGSVVVAPVVEELYFRGFLLPRMPVKYGRWAPLVHTAFFACYHLWTPWLAPTRFLAVLPLVLVARHTKSVRVGITAHMILNAVDLIALTAYLANTR